MKKLFLAISILLVAAVTFAGNSAIKGKVIRTDDKTPISNAYVVLENSNIVIKGCITASNGSFVIENIADGIYDLRVKAIGYQLYFKKNLQL